MRQRSSSRNAGTDGHTRPNFMTGQVRSHVLPVPQMSSVVVSSYMCNLPQGLTETVSRELK